jgi:LysM repeat protein
VRKLGVYSAVKANPMGVLMSRCFFERSSIVLVLFGLIILLNGCSLPISDDAEPAPQYPTPTVADIFAPRPTTDSTTIPAPRPTTVPASPIPTTAPVIVTASPLPEPAAEPSPEPAAEPSPEPAVIEYTVQPGDVLASIAQEFGTTIAAIIELNPEINPDSLQVGDVLLIPVTDAPSENP